MSTGGREQAREVQRRLLRLDRAVPGALAVAVAAGLIGAALLVAQAWVVAQVVADAFEGRRPVESAFLVLGAAIVGRAMLGAVTELAGRWGARRAMAALRAEIAAAALRGRTAPISGARRGEVVTAATQGVDALADYYARAVPAAALAAAVPAGLVVVVIARAPLVGVLLAITLPLVIVFMVLVGMRSASHARERQQALAVLGAHFLEVVRGLPTLRAHGREQAQLPALRTISDQYRDESLSALRVAFLSALVLEFLAMLGTAIAAAVIGVQLAEGRMGLEVGLFVLLLAPEIYAPLRDAGARFHAAEDGTQAARRALAFLDEDGPLELTGSPNAPLSSESSLMPSTRGGGHHVPDPGRAPLVLAGAAARGGAGRLDALAPTDLHVQPGRSLALVGPSGAGKSTLLGMLARLRDPDAGTVHCGEVELRSIPPQQWWRQVAWLAQRPDLPSGELGAVLRAAAGAADQGAASDGADGALDARLEQALGWADAQGIVDELPDGLATRVGPGGRQLSAGQAQRLALAAALASNAPLLLLDEPTAHLDDESAARVRAGILTAATGRTLVVATHDPRLAAACDDMVELRANAVRRAHAQAMPGAASEVSVVVDMMRAAGEAVHRSAQDAQPAEAAQTPARRTAPTRARFQLPGGPFVQGATSALAGVAVLAVSGWLIVHAAERPPVLALLSTIVLVRALGLIRSLGRYGERLSGHDRVLRDLAERRITWYRRLAARVGAADLPATGDLLSRFTADVDTLQDRDLRVRQPAAVAAVVVAAATLGAAILLPTAAPVLLGGALVGGLAGPLLAWGLGRRAAGRQAPARAELAARLDEVVRLGPQLALQGLAIDRARELDASAGALAHADRALARAAAAGGLLTSIGSGAALAGVLAVGAGATVDGALAPTAFGALALLAIAVSEFLRPLPEAALRLVAVQRAEARLQEVADGPPALRPLSSLEPRHLPHRAALVARGLHHRAGGASGPLVLQGANFEIQPGEHVAIVGPSGAGKSTLVGLLGRLTDPDAGTITYGGVDLREAPVDELRQRIRIAGQDAHLLAGTLAANLRIGRPEATDDELHAVLRSVGLGPWLRALPDGLATLVGEDGTAVSGGQRQRLGVARALLSPADLLLLDEPTAMLDASTAAALLEDVLAAAAGRTLLVVTHDGDRLSHFDRVLELRAGHLSERTTASIASAH